MGPQLAPCSIGQLFLGRQGRPYIVNTERKPFLATQAPFWLTPEKGRDISPFLREGVLL